MLKFKNIKLDTPTDNAAINFLRITNNDGSNLTSGTQVTLYGVVE